MTISTLAPVPRQRIRPWLALRGLVDMLRDGDVTEAGARFVLALDGSRPEENYQRFAADPVGARILAEGRSLRATLCERDVLRRFPPGSLGRSYLAFLEEEGISVEALEAATDPVLDEIGALEPVRQFIRDRIAVQHDLWHVLTGYSRDILGELQLLAFSHVQLGTRAFGWIVPIAGFVDERWAPGTRRLLALAKERARRAPWLPALDWEAQLHEPLAGLRERLGVGPPPTYRRYFQEPGGRRLVPEAPDAPRHVLAPGV